MSSFEPVPTMICSGEMASNPCNFAIAVRNSAIPEKRDRLTLSEVQVAQEFSPLLQPELGLELQSEYFSRAEH